MGTHWHIFMHLFAHLFLPGKHRVNKYGPSKLCTWHIFWPPHPRKLCFLWIANNQMWTKPFHPQPLNSQARLLLCLTTKAAMHLNSHLRKHQTNKRTPVLVYIACTFWYILHAHFPQGQLKRKNCWAKHFLSMKAVMFLISHLRRHQASKRRLDLQPSLQRMASS